MVLTYEALQLSCATSQADANSRAPGQSCETSPCSSSRKRTISTM